MEMGMSAGIGGSGGLEDLDLGCEIDFDLEEDDLEDPSLEGFDDSDDLDLTLIYSHISTLNLRDTVPSILTGNAP